MLSIIEKKRNGEELTTSEIRQFVEGMTDETVPDYQVSALLMAIYFKGFTRRETVDLTRALVEGGEVLTYPNEFKPVFDKHSTGGVGDKTSLILVPLLACAGYKVPKMSGRGLGHTGGTIDKLESIPGYIVELSAEELLSQLADVGCAIISQSKNLVPVEKKLYALRDATATVNSLPLIVASILSKKVAGGADAVVVDVKCGSGAFFNTYGDASEFASEIELASREFNLDLKSVITDMHQPIGAMIGNALEVAEVLETLELGNADHGVAHLAIHLAEELLLHTHLMSQAMAEERLIELIRSGCVYEKFLDMVSAQGGDISAFRKKLEGIDKEVEKAEVVSLQRGTVGQLDALTVGRVVHKLGGGRTRMGERINPWVGVEIFKKVGHSVEEGEPLALIYAEKGWKNPRGELLDKEKIIRELSSAYQIW